MKVYDLLEKKMDEMSEADFFEFATAIGSQFGAVLAATPGIEKTKVNGDNLIPVLMDQEVKEVQTGVFIFEYDMSPAGLEKLRTQLYGAAL